MPAGRPSLYRPEYCDAVVAHMAEGASLTSFAASVGVCRDTVTNWMADHPEFLVAAKRGKAACADWWERVNRNLALTGQGNATACVFGLKNMAAADWRDKHEVEHSGGVDLNAKIDMGALSADQLRALASIQIKETNE
jgi:hypothetical protein